MFVHFIAWFLRCCIPEPFVVPVLACMDSVCFSAGTCVALVLLSALLSDLLLQCFAAVVFACAVLSDPQRAGLRSGTPFGLKNRRVYD